MVLGLADEELGVEVAQVGRVDRAAAWRTAYSASSVSTCTAAIFSNGTPR